MKKKFAEFLDSDRAWLLVFGLVVVLLFGYVIIKNNRADTIPANSQTAATSTVSSTETGPAAALVVPTQIPGNVVLVPYVKNEMPLWLSVNDFDENGQPTSLILGASFLRTPGVYQGHEIELLRSTQEGGRYGVVFYRDNGTGQFDPDPTLLLRDENDKIVAVPFAVEMLGSRGSD